MAETAGDVLAQVCRWRETGKPVALATVVNTWGSSPCAAGSHLAVNGAGAFVGSVSGGCIEGAVVAEALQVIADGRSRQLEFGVSDDLAWSVGLACGGSVRIHLERVENPQPLQQILNAQASRQPIAVVTRLADGAQSMYDGSGCGGVLGLSAEQLAEAQRLLLAGRSACLTASGDEVFLRSYTPPARLVIIGAVHIAQLLAPMAALAGFAVTVIDPRMAFATAARFPAVALVTEWPGPALQRIGLDEHSAVVTLSHDPKLDDPALRAALHSPVFYIGALGSSRTHAKRIERLREHGLADSAARIHAPVGLDLGGRGAAEIAVAVLAQVIQVRYQR